MTIRYFPFGAGTGSTVDEAKWSSMAQWFRETGVIPESLNEFEVYADSTGMQVKVKSGTAIIVGHFIDNDAEVIKSISAADPTNPRIDRVVLQVDWVNNDITIDVLTGTPAGSPSAPTLTRNTSVWEFSLAQVAVAAAASTIAAGNVTDERTFSLAGSDGAQMGGRTAAAISSGAVTLKPQAGMSFYSLTGEGATTDTLSTITVSNPLDGALLVLRGQSGYDITIDNAGNISLGENLSQVVIRDNNPKMFVFDATANKWQLLAPEYAGKKSIFIPALGFYPLDDVNTVPEVINNAHPTLAFIDAADDYAVANLEMPKDYNGGALTFYVWWVAAVTGTNAVVWQMSVESLADGQAFAGYDSDTVIDAAQNSTTEVLRSGVISVTPTGWADGELLVLRLGRLGTNGSDTLAGTANLVGVKVEYTTNKENQN